MDTSVLALYVNTNLCLQTPASRSSCNSPKLYQFSISQSTSVCLLTAISLHRDTQQHTKPPPPRISVPVSVRLRICLPACVPAGLSGQLHLFYLFTAFCTRSRTLSPLSISKTSSAFSPSCKQAQDGRGHIPTTGPCPAALGFAETAAANGKIEGAREIREGERGRERGIQN